MLKINTNMHVIKLGNVPSFIQDLLIYTYILRVSQNNNSENNNSEIT